jgi:osmoprotectant transport system substrate-binding protein
MRVAPRAWRQGSRPGVVVCAIVVAALLAACGDSPDRARDQPDPGVVRVASFDFAESDLLAELFAQVIEARGIPVERHFGLGSREIVEPALAQGLVDVVPEYLASALEFAQLGSNVTSSPADTAADLREVLEPRNVSVLAHAPAVDRNAVAVTAETARQLDLETLSDLAAPSPVLDFIGPPECPDRPACLPVLEETYGIRFHSFTAVPIGGIPLQLEAGEADAGVVFTSDPGVQEHDLVLLRPDREKPRAENVVPVVRAPVLERFPEITGALDQVTSRLTTRELRALNKRVADGQDVAAVAREWLT